VNGRSGPVVVSLPEDMQNDLSPAFTPTHYKRASSAPGQDAVADLQARIEAAERPLVILGGSGWSAESVAQIRSFAEVFGLPVATGFRRQDLFDNTHPNYAGVIGLGTNPALVEMVREADLLLVIGERLGDMTSASYTLFDFPRSQSLIHVHSGAEELESFTKATCSLMPVRATLHRRWPRWFRTMRSTAVTRISLATAAISVSPRRRASASPGSMLPESSAISATGCRQCDHQQWSWLYTAYVHRYYTFRDYGSQLAPTSGAMGYGLPARWPRRWCIPIARRCASRATAAS
jgi:acetolactate synthase-1/2/3 large subunit